MIIQFKVHVKLMYHMGNPYIIKVSYVFKYMFYCYSPLPVLGCASGKFCAFSRILCCKVLQVVQPGNIVVFNDAYISINGDVY